MWLQVQWIEESSDLGRGVRLVAEIDIDLDSIVKTPLVSRRASTAKNRMRL